MIMTLGGKTPQVSPEAFVAETAALIGDVTVGRDSSVWFGAVIRGDNDPIVVGEGTSIQDNAVLHTEKGTRSRWAATSRWATAPLSTAPPWGTIRWSAWARSCSTAR